MSRPLDKRDAVIDQLNALRMPDLSFVAATDEVLHGLDLRATGNRHYGKQVYIATGRVPDVDLRRIASGASIAVGAIERRARGELRCCLEDGAAVVAAFDKTGKRVGRALAHRPAKRAPLADGDRLDEALFTWLSPAEDYCTPWSDSSPAVCQVITVERLRRLID